MKSNEFASSILINTLIATKSDNSDLYMYQNSLLWHFMLFVSLIMPYNYFSSVRSLSLAFFALLLKLRSVLFRLLWMPTSHSTCVRFWWNIYAVVLFVTITALWMLANWNVWHCCTSISMSIESLIELIILFHTNVSSLFYELYSCTHAHTYSVIHLHIWLFIYEQCSSNSSLFME